MKANIVVDSKYGFSRVEPIPTQEEVEKFYAKEFYESNSAYFNNSALLLQQEQSDFFNAKWQAVFEQIELFFDLDLSDKSVFDIGFGFAQALLFLREKGLAVAGLEPSHEGVEYARGRGINAIHGGIENFDLIKSRSDVVMLMNVLEHLRNPEETLINIRKKV